MPRYFIEVSYIGTAFSGFQVQKRVRTVQGELERVLAVYTKEQIGLTGSSRTDGGVHARQNYFHFDRSEELQGDWLYNLNAMLPQDLAVREICQVPAQAHCRFDAVSREYDYMLYGRKDPFRMGRGWQYPFPLKLELMQEAAQMVVGQHDFRGFSKRGMQVKDFVCKVEESEWVRGDDQLNYRIRGNRFLRGMVRSLVGGMVRIGRGQLELKEWKEMIEGNSGSAAKWLAPAEGLVLCRVRYDGQIADFLEKGKRRR
jgi:tRNA pseudouridine38-40 synthase